MINKRFKIQQRRDADMQKTLARVGKFAGVRYPGPKALEKYISALDALRDELTERHGDLGNSPHSAGGRLESERYRALALLAELRIASVKPE